MANHKQPYLYRSRMLRYPVETCWGKTGPVPQRVVSPWGTGPTGQCGSSCRFSEASEHSQLVLLTDKTQG